MAPPDPNRPQVVNAELIAEVIRLLKLRGPLGTLNVLDDVRLTFGLGSAGFIKSLTFAPAFQVADVKSEGIKVAAPANTLHADTGQLSVGSYDLDFFVQQDAQAAEINWEFQWRNAANTANVTVTQVLSRGGIPPISFPVVVETANQRFRLINIDAFAVGARSYGEIDIAKRPDPGFVGVL